MSHIASQMRDLFSTIKTLEGQLNNVKSVSIKDNRLNFSMIGDPEEHKGKVEVIKEENKNNKTQEADALTSNGGGVLMKDEQESKRIAEGKEENKIDGSTDLSKHEGKSSVESSQAETKQQEEITAVPEATTDKEVIRAPIVNEDVNNEVADSNRPRSKEGKANRSLENYKKSNV
jgi:hypothetical protein